MSSTHLVRPATVVDARAIAEVLVQSWRSTYRGVLDEAYLEALDVERQTERALRGLVNPRQWTVVGTEPDGRVVGFCTVGPNRGAPVTHAGEIYAIYLLETSRGRGLGRRLFERAALRLESNGSPSFLVWVLAANGSAARFYERMGGERLGERPIDIGDRTYPAVAYAWTAVAGP